MGLWQLGIYDTKHDDSGRKLRSAAPVELLDLWGPDDPYHAQLEGRPVWVRGTFTGEQVLIARGENRFWTVAPLRVEDSASLLLIVRGWSGPESPPLPKGTVTFRATLQAGEETSGVVDPRTGAYPSLSIASMANVLQGDLFSGYAVTTAEGITGGLEPVEPKPPHVSWMVGLRNLAYAMQWWTFGAFSAFMWWRMATDAIGGREQADTVAG
jgi:cytochrome oxidase assembly protein ShyY1